jgi:hypothetical protein
MSTTNDHRHRSPNGEQRRQPSNHTDEEPLWVLLAERLGYAQRFGRSRRTAGYVLECSDVWPYCGCGVSGKP